MNAYPWFPEQVLKVVCEKLFVHIMLYMYPHSNSRNVCTIFLKFGTNIIFCNSLDKLNPQNNPFILG